MRWRLPTLVTLALVVVLAVGSALAGLAIHGPTGAAVGAMIGGLAGVAAGYVPVFQDWARQTADRRAEARKGLMAVSEPQLQKAAPGPSLLLRPELAVVGFTGRDVELADCGPGARWIARGRYAS